MPRCVRRWVAKLVAVAVLVVAVLAVAKFGLPGWPFGASTTDRTQPALLHEVVQLEQLTAAEGRFSIVVDVEHKTDGVPSIIVGDRTTMIAVGTVPAVVDLGGLTDAAITVHDDGRVVFAVIRGQRRPGVPSLVLPGDPDGCGWFAIGGGEYVPFPSPPTGHPARERRTVRYVGRPTRWGNPYRVVKGRSGLLGVITPDEQVVNLRTDCTGSEAARVAVRGFQHHLDHLDRSKPRAVLARHLAPLVTADVLSCWCPLDAPCHATRCVTWWAASGPVTWCPVWWPRRACAAVRYASTAQSGLSQRSRAT
jgi:hypothetical protein